MFLLSVSVFCLHRHCVTIHSFNYVTAEFSAFTFFLPKSTQTVSVSVCFSESDCVFNFPSWQVSVGEKSANHTTGFDNRHTEQQQLTGDVLLSFQAETLIISAIMYSRGLALAVPLLLCWLRGPC